MATSGYPLSPEQRLYGALRQAEEESTDRGEGGRAAGVRAAIRLVSELLPDAVWEWDEVPPANRDGEDRQALRDARMLLERLRFHTSLDAAFVDDDDVAEAARLAPILNEMAHRSPLSHEEYTWVEYLRARPESRPSPEVIAAYLS
jgi:hypothetical protein